jgi:hypothetical protein
MEKALSLPLWKKSAGLFFGAPVVFYMALIFCASGLSHPLPFGWVLPFAHADKAVHIFQYAGLGFLLFRAAVRHWGLKSSRSLALVFALGLAYALFDELHQSFVPFRSPDAADALADALGLWLGRRLVS